MSELSMDVFWSFRSPWSCLATPRLRDWQDRYVLNVRFRPVYPIAIRTPEFFLNAHPQWAPCFQQDLRRVAEYLGLPLVWPNPDPVSQYRDEVSRLIWQGTEHWHEVPHLADAAARAGLDLAEMDRIQSDESARAIPGRRQVCFARLLPADYGI
jgi:2-hydroxychromene-2-carboxylate isomerase